MTGPSYPIFTCPNCRAAADLDADIEEPDEEWQQMDSGAEDANMEDTSVPTPPANSTADSVEALPRGARDPATPSTRFPSGDAGDVTMMIDHPPSVEEPMRVPTPTARPTASSPVAIPRPAIHDVNGVAQPRTVRTPSPNEIRTAPHEGPLTPRNDAGPWVFDGDAGRASQEVARPDAMANLDATATNTS